MIRLVDEPTSVVGMALMKMIDRPLSVPWVEKVVRYAYE
jgi:hypothetical protein